MEVPQTSSTLEKDTTITSDVTMDKAPTSDPADLSPVAQDNQLRVFVALLTVRVLNKCHALKRRRQEDWISHAKRLVDQTMEGLHLAEAFCPDVSKCKKACKVIVKDLQKKFGGKRSLQSVILLEDQAVDQVLVDSLQSHIRILAADATNISAQRCWWRDALQVLAFVAGILAAFVLMALVP